MDKEVNVENEINLESTEYNRLFAKMTHYSNTYFPICDFLNDIKNNKEPNFQKLNAYNDLEKIFDLYFSIKAIHICLNASIMDLMV